MIYLLERGEKGYRILDIELFSVEDSKPMTTRDSEGLAAIDFQAVFEIVQKLGLLDRQFVEPEHSRTIRWHYGESQFRIRELRASDALNVKWHPLEWFKAANMRKEILKEWKDYEDWHFSRQESPDQ